MITIRNKEEFGYIVKSLGLNPDTSIHIVEGVINGIELDIWCQGLKETSKVSALIKEEDGVITVHMSYDLCAADKEELEVINNFSSRFQVLCDVANRFCKYTV